MSYRGVNKTRSKQTNFFYRAILAQQARLRSRRHGDEPDADIDGRSQLRASQWESGLFPIRDIRTAAYKKQKSQGSPGFFMFFNAKEIMQLLPCRQLLFRPDGPAARCKPSARCHQRGSPSSRCADIHHYDWHNADPVRQTA